jgi:predicted ATP-binding protein involved in virulence
MFLYFTANEWVHNVGACSVTFCYNWEASFVVPSRTNVALFYVRIIQCKTFRQENTRMKISKLELRNFRSIQNIDFEFDPHLNVFYGVNGSGKSTILDALALMLSWLVARIKNPKTNGNIISDIDIKNKTTVSSLSLYFKTSQSEESEEGYNWKTSRGRDGRILLDKENKPNYTGLQELSEAIYADFSKENASGNLPVFIYYDVSRVVKDIPLRIKKKHLFETLSTYENALKRGSDFRLFFEWFRVREDIEKEKREDILKDGFETVFKNYESHYEALKKRSAKPNGDHLNLNKIRESTVEGVEKRLSAEELLKNIYEDVQLKSVRRALENFLPEFTNFRVQRSPLLMLVDKNGIKYSIQQLSDGEKCLMALIGDLARRLAIANPNLENPLEGEGAVLIDEIDLHLHPKWQQIVIQRLTSTFPNIQFFISTHSPFVLTETKPEQLFCLKQENGEMKVETGLNTYGHTSERILEDFMGLERTRPQVIEEKIKSLYQLLNEKKIEALKIKLNELKSELQDEVLFAEIEAWIHRYEVLGQ